MRHSVQIIGDNLGLTSLITGTKSKQVKTKDSGGLKSTYNFFFLHILCSTAFSNNI